MEKKAIEKFFFLLFLERVDLGLRVVFRKVLRRVWREIFQGFFVEFLWILLIILVDFTVLKIERYLTLDGETD
jgi:hypothetical protein